MRAFLTLLLLAAPATAQEVTPQQALAALPPDIAERIAARPDRFAAMAGDLILAHGTGDAVTGADIDRALSLDRAYFRARALRPFLESDLDADGTVTGDETRARAAILGADGRARLIRAHIRADTDADGSLSPEEIAAQAQADTARALTPEDEGMARAILAFDLNGDGRAALAEIETAAAALSADG